ncbi:hypothetical protein [Niveispirillum cyanobacteriorum]|uniref:Uncharacterized protein n=1 Tax=Niveispirillum cyanobacteriorum TaxID=1612173 RepID=A0A2K9NCC2_9PROT|nr:hypothetical protein [Niveispirillum cyanobacteriorum]AUN30790.1 hypothetical protein C0V82_11465 [Niveispirillum cyanobacteriorum]GGE79616.1 hypothetical protein GCM10011317_40950 [Niveispirillum cyanobacteriorum]
MSAIDLPSLALILAALARGGTHVHVRDAHGLAALMPALTALGATVAAGETWRVQGRGMGGWCEPDRVLDLTARPGAVPLLTGALAAHDVTAVLAAESVSLTGLRPALERVGARLTVRRGDLLPGTITGTPWPIPALHEGLGPSKGMGLLLAGLNSPGRTGVTMLPDMEPALDLLRRFGAGVSVEDGNIWVKGYPDLLGPSDPIQV